ncbi:adenylate/guanylate cyclase domain-containing protein [Aestuariivita boseongensis]|uniref:adenylate/guanylate cyclase domain-containing protein n=1 Tax=Aestuariivita boseongensis TaxID=1470562 RepID=UPI0006827964|nr:adenylate/guanylate cyclase domain-containing protein [Aestuariivita boseongensis]
MRPETRYALSGELSIAYQVFGDGEQDLVFVPGWISNIDLFWDEPIVARFLSELSSFCRVILFDKRGTGLSDRGYGAATLEERMDDVRAVMDAVGSESATIFGYSEGGPMSVLFAATYPERTRALILAGSYASRRAHEGYTEGLSEADVNILLEKVRAAWGTPLDIEARIPSLADNPRFRNWWARFLRGGASPSAALALLRMNLEIDVRPILASVQAPSLILHSSRDQIVSCSSGRYLAENIPHAQMVEIDADDHVPFTETSERVLAEVRQFVTGQDRVQIEERILGTIMFTDIVGSTKIAHEIGDRAWTDTLAAHHDEVRNQLEIYGGREIKTTGDGFLAMFDGPARAIRCGHAIQSAMDAIGLRIRIGVHTGECTISGDDVSGIAVHIAARIGGMADAGQVLVSQTVRDLVAGSGIFFDNLGAHELRGVDGQWSICHARLK